MASGPLTLAQLAQVAGMTTADVKVCLDDGLLAPPRRPLGRRGTVGFHKDHVHRLTVVRRCLELGFSRQEIRRIADTSILLTCRDMHELTEPHVERLNGEGRTDAAALLAALREKCPKVGGRQECPIPGRDSRQREARPPNLRQLGRTASVV